MHGRGHDARRGAQSGTQNGRGCGAGRGRGCGAGQGDRAQSGTQYGGTERGAQSGRGCGAGHGAGSGKGHSIVHKRNCRAGSKIGHGAMREEEMSLSDLETRVRTGIPTVL